MFPEKEKPRMRRKNISLSRISIIWWVTSRISVTSKFSLNPSDFSYIFGRVKKWCEKELYFAVLGLEAKSSIQIGGFR